MSLCCTPVPKFEEMLRLRSMVVGGMTQFLKNTKFDSKKGLRFFGCYSSRTRRPLQIRAAQVLARKRAAAAVVISALGRGFQGRREGRRLRVERHNAAATKIQDQFRARAARRYGPKVVFVVPLLARIRVRFRSNQETTCKTFFVCARANWTPSSENARTRCTRYSFGGERHPESFARTGTLQPRSCTSTRTVFEHRTKTCPLR